MRVFLAVALLSLSSVTLATSQIPDVLVVDGSSVVLHSQPFAALLKNNPELEKSLAEYPRGGCSASWFGFQATWEISNGKLFLTKLVSNPCSHASKIVPLDLIPGSSNGKVLASWFSGRLVVPHGDLVEYVHMGFESKYESYVIYSIQDGEVTDTTEQTDLPAETSN